jgi:hypothetical protein
VEQLVDRDTAQFAGVPAEFLVQHDVTLPEKSCRVDFLAPRANDPCPRHPKVAVKRDAYRSPPENQLFRGALS